MSLVRPTTTTFGELWGLWTVAVIRGYSHADSILEFIRRSPIRLQEIMFKPAHFKGYVEGGYTIRECLESYSPVFFLGRERAVSYWEILTTLQRLGLRLDFCWDPHGDGDGETTGTRGDYHRDPGEGDMYRFPMQSNSSLRVRNASLAREVADEIHRHFPGLITCVTCSNEPYYQPRWSFDHTPDMYGSWVALMSQRFWDWPDPIEMVGVAQDHFHGRWMQLVAPNGHPLWKYLTLGIHTVFPPDITGGYFTPDDAIAAIDLDYQKSISQRPDKSVDPHDLRYRSDELLPFGSRLRVNSPEARAVWEAVIEWISSHRSVISGANVLGINGVTPWCSADWRVCSGLIAGIDDEKPAGTWSESAYAFTRGSGPAPPPLEDEVKAEDFAALANLTREQSQLEREYDRGELGHNKYRQRHRGIQKKAKVLVDEYGPPRKIEIDDRRGGALSSDIVIRHRYRKGAP